MKYEFPDVETLMEIAEKDPDELDRIKHNAINAIIDSASPNHQPRLRGLQWQVDMELNKSKTPMERCIRASSMMHDKLWELKHTLQAQQQPEFEVVCEVPLAESMETAEILPFRS